MGVNRGPAESKYVRAARQQAANAERVRKTRERKKIELTGTEVLPPELQRGRSASEVRRRIPGADSATMATLIGGSNAMLPASGGEPPIFKIHRLIDKELGKQAPNADKAYKWAQTFSLLAGGIQKMQRSFSTDELRQVVELVESSLSQEVHDQLVVMLQGFEARRGLG